MTDTIEETVEGVPEPVPEPDYHEMTRILMAEIREYGHPMTGWFVGRDVFLLTTTGAKSGEPRTVPLAYSRDGDDLHRDGVQGRRADPSGLVLQPPGRSDGTIEVDLETIKVRASIAEGAERQRLWDQHVAIHTGIGEYPQKTDRIIPVVVADADRGLAQDRAS